MRPSDQLGIVKTGDQNDRSGPVLVDPLRGVQTIHVRHLDIRHDQVWRKGDALFDHFSAGFRREHDLVTHGWQDSLIKSTDLGIVIGDDDA